MKVGAEFIKTQFPGDSKVKGERIIVGIVDAFKERLRMIDWMDSASRKKAIAKVSRKRTKSSREAAICSSACFEVDTLFDTSFLLFFSLALSGRSHQSQDRLPSLPQSSVSHRSSCLLLSIARQRRRLLRRRRSRDGVRSSEGLAGCAWEQEECGHLGDERSDRQCLLLTPRQRGE